MAAPSLALCSPLSPLHTSAHTALRLLSQRSPLPSPSPWCFLLWPPALPWASLRSLHKTTPGACLFPPIKPVAELFPYSSGFLSVPIVRENGAHPSLLRASIPSTKSTGRTSGETVGRVGGCHLASRSNGSELGVKRPCLPTLRVRAEPADSQTLPDLLSNHVGGDPVSPVRPTLGCASPFAASSLVQRLLGVSTTALNRLSPRPGSLRLARPGLESPGSPSGPPLCLGPRSESPALTKPRSYVPSCTAHPP